MRTIALEGSKEDPAKLQEFKQEVRKVSPHTCPPSEQLLGVNKSPLDGKEPTGSGLLGHRGVGLSFQACPRMAMWPEGVWASGKRTGRPIPAHGLE